MKKLNELKKSKKGFTLIELIIVIAILGVLAAILVPSLLGTVKTSKDQVKATNAQTLYSTAQAAYVSVVAAGKELGTSPHAPVTASGSTNDALVTEILKNLGNKFSTDWSVATDSNGVTSVTYESVTFDGNNTSFPS